MQLSRFFFCALVSVFLFGLPVAADPTDAFEICAVIDNDEARLQCFDEAVARLQKAASKETAEDEPPQESASTEVEETSDHEEDAENTGRAEAENGEIERPSVPFLVEEVENEEDLAHCKSLGTVTGKSGWGGRAVKKARNGIVKSAKKKAWEIGATHILVGRLEISTSMSFSTAEVEAYACPD